MEREELDRLLAEYATGGLSAEDRQRLLAAALEDQALFDQLMEEDALREVIELPGARDRLIDALEEEPVLAMRAAVAAPAPAAVPAVEKKRPAGPPLWLAWAAGIGVVFVSGAITYLMLGGTELKELAGITRQETRETKPFVPPPAAVTPQPPAKPAIVEAPPPVVAERRREALPAVNIPLPSAPAPMIAPAPAPARAAEVASVEKENKVMADAAPAAKVAERFQAPAGPAAGAVGGLASSGVRDTALARKEEARKPVTVASEAPALRPVASPVSPASLWRRTGDGVWTRVAADGIVERTDRVVVRYTAVAAGTVVLSDDGGRALARREARGGEEVELPVPAEVLARSAGGSVTLTVGSARVVIRVR